MKTSSKNSSSKLIVLTGIDGSGKTSILKRLSLHPERYLIIPEKKDTIKSSFNIRKNKRLGKIVQSLPSKTRALFIASGIFIEYEAIILPSLLSGKVVICNSYYYNIYAKEKIYGKADKILYEFLSSLRKPDFIIFIDIPPEKAYERKTYLNPYEYIGKPNKYNFSKFQREVRSIILETISEIPHKILNISALSLVEVTKAVNKIILSEVCKHKEP